MWIGGWIFAAVVGLYVARWWLMTAVLTPVVVLGGLELLGYRGPWESSGPPLTVLLWWPLGWGLFWFFVLPLGGGIALRRALGERGVGTGLADAQRGPGTPLNS